MVAFIATAFVQPLFAQHSHTSHPAQSNGLLKSYYSIKDALVAGNSTLAAAKGEELAKALNTSDNKVGDDNIRKSLLEHTRQITGTKDLKDQREHFAALTNDMIAVAKTSRLSTEPVYQFYCPMAKANWLSKEKEVKNPYYGSAMLSCGKVVETFN